MNKRLEKMIPHAFKAVEKNLVKNNQISKQYNGYISSFGASVVQSGMLLALLFNHRENKKNEGGGGAKNERGKEQTDSKESKKSLSNSEEDKGPLMDAICYIVRKIRDDEKNGYISLLAYFKDNESDKKLKHQIMDAATAIKLVIRTYKLTDNVKG